MRMRRDEVWRTDNIFRHGRECERLNTDPLPANIYASTLITLFFHMAVHSQLNILPHTLMWVPVRNGCLEIMPIAVRLVARRHYLSVIMSEHFILSRGQSL
ncbi:uncharacterized protein PV06_11758 [Exophiala oligosperma]|uniref:Uncharacterized protein n=1 Tax=Exophiala oligosperma TaxID=215243 RepID=A0A0D2BEL2_9EURO|nr:uncharacterized protein PV06_11758 [Exophiala oligosperma]KIW35932.1 hypothetical protein PV06_11758 [Exophiala oligosperma]